MSRLEWSKSSYSTGAQGSCLELARLDVRARVHLRESDDPAVVISTGPAALGSLLNAVRAGRLPTRGK
ncbi:hypothetical protein GCM10010218_32610 [Streptomyces mashuensis]|uniref:DUF397 domain-containing protein n=1 Tax=Streptomyces mashuensis TaxID=33904 RepID=A0A919EDE1_9ACTN|nr:DUF397 domain-containing protein [Streptomyces mashuensis]GHF48604.1 hypothetical protein GCM10010218_32610 [Streptomyces mashuensis]